VLVLCFFFAALDGELMSGGGGGGLGDDGDGVMEGEEGGGWEVGDDDLELPPDLVREEIRNDEYYFIIGFVMDCYP
jgi:hypothetical protein